jgi:hypothetical protein
VRAIRCIHQNEAIVPMAYAGTAYVQAGSCLRNLRSAANATGRLHVAYRLLFQLRTGRAETCQNHDYRPDVGSTAEPARVSLVHF